MVVPESPTGMIPVWSGIGTKPDSPQPERNGRFLLSGVVCGHDKLRAEIASTNSMQNSRFHWVRWDCGFLPVAT